MVVMRNEKENINEIIKRFIESYVQNEKSATKKDILTWLSEKLKEELIDKNEEEVNIIALELIEGIKQKEIVAEELKKSKLAGITNSDFVGDKILESIELIDDDTEKTFEYLKEVSEELEIENTSDIYETAYLKEQEMVAGIIGANNSIQYIETINSAIDTANEKIVNSILNKDGNINMNKNLDGFIFEQDHANTFNIDAAIKRKQNLVAEALEPGIGETYGKNSVDLVIRENGKIVRKYQAKAGKDNYSTEKLFEHGDYRGQRKLITEGQEVKNSTDTISYDNVQSVAESKQAIKIKQEKVQSGDLEAVKRNFKNDVRTIEVAKQIGRQTMVSARTGMAIGALTTLGKQVIEGEGIDGEEIVVNSLKVGGTAGLSAAVAGGLKVAVEKKVVGGILAKTLTSNNVIGAISASAVDIVSAAYKLGSGEISLGEANKRIGAALASFYGWTAGFSIGKALAIGVIGSVGGVLGVAVAVVAGAVVGTVASGAARAIANGIGTVTGAIIDGTVEIVKSGAKAVGTVAKGVWNGVKAVGDAVVSVGKSVFSGIGSVAEKICSWFW